VTGVGWEKNWHGRGRGGKNLDPEWQKRDTGTGGNCGREKKNRVRGASRRASDRGRQNAEVENETDSKGNEGMTRWLVQKSIPTRRGKKLGQIEGGPPRYVSETGRASGCRLASTERRCPTLCPGPQK